MIGLAIPTWERVNLLYESFAKVEADDRVGSITIVDDASSDKVWDHLRQKSYQSEKWCLTRNEKNLGCYLNKRMAVFKSPHHWVALFDSDNVMGPDYLDALERVGPWDPNTLYVPTFARPAFDYRAYAGVEIDDENLAEYFDRPRFATALNTGNFFVNREAYLEAFDLTTDPMAADSMYFCYCWIKSGRRILFVPGLEYFHRVHNGNYVQYAERSAKFFEELARKMRTYEAHW